MSTLFENKLITKAPLNVTIGRLAMAFLFPPHPSTHLAARTLYTLDLAQDSVVPQE
jgi:hypothetical protein